MKRDWWLILRDEVVIGAALTEAAARMKVDDYLSRLPVHYERIVDGNLWVGEKETIKIVNVVEKEKDNG